MTEAGEVAISLEKHGITLDGDGVSGTRTRQYVGRLCLALSQQASGIAAVGHGDLLVLVRAVLRAAGENARLVLPNGLIAPFSDVRWASAGLHAEVVGGRVSVRATEWRPLWLEGKPERPLYEEQPRRPDEAVAGDPMLALVGWDTYQTTAQAEAVRTVVSAPPSATVVVNLPTGAGKSLCALLPALVGAPTPEQLGVTIVVVPTVALQLDLEQRTRATVAHDTAYRPGEPSASGVLARIDADIQGPVFISPEALFGRGIWNALRGAARRGAIRALVIDEAHMVSTWGNDFRPAFQQLAGLRRELLNLASTKPFKTILMSATLTPYSLRALRELFGTPGPYHHVHAVRLRPEPEYWIAKVKDQREREDRVVEALWHMPRPLILYTTKRPDAIKWFGRLRREGFGRCAIMHGELPSDARALALQQWARDELDVMVATSAFGLGVDKPDVRAVVHAALPEGIDRYYQDVGRAGRDGYGSVSLLAWADADVKTARGLAVPTFIGEERGFERWTAMFTSSRREVLGGQKYRVPVDVPPSSRRGDIDMDSEENIRWNVRTLLLMARAGLLEIHHDTGTSANAVSVRILDHRHFDSQTWNTVVGPRRDELARDAKKSFDLIVEAISGGRCIGSVLRDAYASREEGVLVTLSCGGCPACRASGASILPGRLRPAHSPPQPWQPSPVGARLSLLLGGSRSGLVLYDGVWNDNTSNRLIEVVRWLAQEGVRNLVLPAAVRSAWKNKLSFAQYEALFLHSDLPDGVVAAQPTAALVTQGNDPLWPRVFDHIRTGNAVAVYVLARDLCDPTQPARFARDMLTAHPRLSLREWEEWYLE